MSKIKSILRALGSEKRKEIAFHYCKTFNCSQKVYYRRLNEEYPNLSVAFYFSEVLFMPIEELYELPEKLTFKNSEDFPNIKNDFHKVAQFAESRT
jgi:hypothetical protein